MYRMHGVASIGRLAGTNASCNPLALSVLNHYLTVTLWHHTGRKCHLLGTVISLALSTQAHYSRMSGFDIVKIIQSQSQITDLCPTFVKPVDHPNGGPMFETSYIQIYILLLYSSPNCIRISFFVLLLF